MRSPSRAIAWEIWSARRLAFLTALAAVPSCALVYYLFSDLIQRSELLRSFSFLPMGASLLFLFVAFNYTERRSKAGFAGFPARLFTLPVATPVLVTCPMAYGVAAILVVYVGWAWLLRSTIGVEMQVGWPALLLATGLILVLGLVVAYSATWMLLVRGLPLGLFGRLGAFLTYLGLDLTLFFVVPAILIGWFASNPERLNHLLEYLHWMPWSAFVWGLFAVFVLKLWGGVAAWDEAGRRDLVSSRTVRRYLVVWLTGTACFATFVHLVVWTPEWVQHLATLSALSLFPLAGIGLSPLALAQNRHR
jgi:hypothetical protein